MTFLAAFVALPRPDYSARPSKRSATEWSPKMLAEMRDPLVVRQIVIRTSPSSLLHAHAPVQNGGHAEAGGHHRDRVHGVEPAEGVVQAMQPDRRLRRWVSNSVSGEGWHEPIGVTRLGCLEPRHIPQASPAGESTPRSLTQWLL